MPLHLTPTFRDALAGAPRPLVGMWVCSGSPLVAEICAGSGLDWLLVDMEHSPNGLESVLAQLQAVAAYPVTPVVRVPTGDVVTIKQVLDLGAQNLLVPMVSSADQAQGRRRGRALPAPRAAGRRLGARPLGPVEPGRRVPRRRRRARVAGRADRDRRGRGRRRRDRGGRRRRRRLRRAVRPRRLDGAARPADPPGRRRRGPPHVRGRARGGQAGRRQRVRPGPRALATSTPAPRSCSSAPT